MTGAVRSARALHYAFDEDPNPGELTVRPSSDVTVELDAVPGAGTQLPGCTREHQVLAYRVELEIADVAELPTYVSDEYAALTPVIGSSTGAAGRAPCCLAPGYSGAVVGEADTPQKSS
ncbi:hypothetical protein [Kocuria arenosa]|uniref:hypothetical protein n=1 Tax=Kocuria arenosa TaxID=3071446 RepID=UPI0034D67658